MERCPLCRAALNGAETCRRCRAELQSVKRVEREGEVLLEAAIHRLAVDDFVTAERLLRRAGAGYSCGAGNLRLEAACNRVVATVRRMVIGGQF
jgi:hypothetical protein